ncbi:MAG: ribonuclease J [Candidatus Colwellbacteria bacterium]|nr:ribonuclease J [Candidatus Colwellbacteria bacterium]
MPQATVRRRAITLPRKVSSAAPAPKRSRAKTAPAGEESLRLIPFGGLEEIGRNMSVLEYKDEIIIIDVGIQFPEEETPGIDYIIPNIASLLPKKQNIRAVVLTHGHYDHIGAIPYLIGKLGNPPIYTLPLTKAIIEKRQEEFVNAPKLNVVVVKHKDKVKIGRYLELEFFSVEHPIPDNTGVVIKTPIGNIVHFSDFRLDYDAEGNPQGLDIIEKIGDLGIHTLMIDSTNAEEEGHSVSERVVEENLEELFRKAEGRIIVATFSSMLTRIAEMIKIAEKLNRRVIINGRSMKDNIQIAQKLGYIKFKKETSIPIQEINKHKDNKIFVISTGGQGEPGAGLTRIIAGEHRHIQIKPTDTVIFSSSVVPGNERSVQNLRDSLARQGADVYTSKMLDIHASGHAPKEDLKTVMKLVRPKFIMPIHGYYFMRAANGKNAVEVGIPKENVRLLDNGQVALLTKNQFIVSGESVPANYIMVDGLGVGDVEEIVLRDRMVLSQEGMIVLIVTIDRKTGRLVKNPDIISRGFIYLREHQELLNEIRNRVRGIVGRLPRQSNLDVDYLKSLFRDQVGQFIYSKTNRRPMILPVIIGV